MTLKKLVIGFVSIAHMGASGALFLIGTYWGCLYLIRDLSDESLLLILGIYAVATVYGEFSRSILKDATKDGD